MSDARPGPVPGPDPVLEREVLLTRPNADKVLRMRPILVAAAGPALLLLSFGVGNRWIALVACLLLAAVGVAVATLQRVWTLSVRVEVPVRTRVGEVVEHVFHLHNHGPRDLPPAVLHFRGDAFAAGHTALPAIPAGASVALRVPREAGLRCFSPGPEVLVEAADNLGLLTVERVGRVAAPVHVHPAPATPPTPALPPASAGVEDVAGVRPFRRGDRVSSVHWRASARRGALSAPSRGAGAGLVVVEREAEPVGPLVVAVGSAACGDGLGDGVAWEELLASAAALVRRELSSGRVVRVVVDGASGEGLGALDVLAAAGGPTPVDGVAARAAAGRDGRVLVGELGTGWRFA
ncbi:DUF58 domain-containing protein [Kineococcus sp. GCM10028916]|uniref:DUF58 domain-containing protein n=1 Tax=Kineococcus sp. GCM10028916 TaxID=3273394 RepID=UPI0036330144